MKGWLRLDNVGFGSQVMPSLVFFVEKSPDVPNKENETTEEGNKVAHQGSCIPRYVSFVVHHFYSQDHFSRSLAHVPDEECVVRDINEKADKTAEEKEEHGEEGVIVKAVGGSLQGQGIEEAAYERENNTVNQESQEASPDGREVERFNLTSGMNGLFRCRVFHEDKLTTRYLYGMSGRRKEASDTE